VWGIDQSNALAEPSVADLINAHSSNSNFSDLELIRIEIYPALKMELFSEFVQTTFINWKDPPPITENDALLLESLVRDCTLVECKPSGKFACPVMMYVKE